MKNTYHIKHKKDAQDFFLEKFYSIDGFYKMEKYPDSLFGYKDDGKTYLWEINYKNKRIWIRYPLIWIFLREDYNMERTDIQKLIISVLRESFNIEGFTSLIKMKRCLQKLGEPFKVEDFSPHKIQVN